MDNTRKNTTETGASPCAVRPPIGPPIPLSRRSLGFVILRERGQRKRDQFRQIQSQTLHGTAIYADQLGWFEGSM